MLEVGLLTMQKVSMLLIYIALGYILRKSGKVPENTGKVLSALTTLLFCPAYYIRNMSQNLTVEKVGSNLLLLGFGIACLTAIIALAFGLSRVFGRGEHERNTLVYAFTFPNYGYFGYPVIEGIFGSQVLVNTMVFAVPISIACTTWGYLLLVKDGKLTLKQILKSPLIISVFVGCALGLSGIQIPGMVDSVLSGLAGCMSPASMLLAGFVLGSFPLKKLLTSARAYGVAAIRLIGIPALLGAVLLLLGARGIYLLIPFALFSMPLGLNLVVYPESVGKDASENARLCFASYIMAVLVLPVSFSVIAWLSGI